MGLPNREASQGTLWRGAAPAQNSCKLQRGRGGDTKDVRPPDAATPHSHDIAFKLRRRDVTLLCGHQMVPDSVLNQFGIALSAKYFHHPVLVIRNGPARHLEDAAHLLHYSSLSKQLQYLTLPWC
jgi:hypothetical protein